MRRFELRALHCHFIENVPCRFIGLVVRLGSLLQRASLIIGVVHGRLVAGLVGAEPRFGASVAVASVSAGRIGVWALHFDGCRVHERQSREREMGGYTVCWGKGKQLR